VYTLAKSFRSFCEDLYSTTTQCSCQEPVKAGAGVIWNGDPLEPPVIPAKAGIQSDESTFPKVCGLDSRFRGND